MFIVFWMSDSLRGRLTYVIILAVTSELELPYKTHPLLRIQKQAREFLTFLPSCSSASDRLEKAIQLCLQFIVQLTKFIISDMYFRKFPTDGLYSIAFILNNGWITGFSGVLINCDPAGICFLPEDHVCPSAFLVLTVESCLSRPLPCVQVERDREILIKALN